MRLSCIPNRRGRLSLILVAFVLSATVQSNGARVSDREMPELGNGRTKEERLLGASTHGHAAHNSSPMQFNIASGAGNGWLTLDHGRQTVYEKFYNPTTTPEKIADQLLTAAIAPSKVQGELRVLVINIATPTRIATPTGPLAEAYAEAANLVRQISRGLAAVKIEIFDRPVVVPDVNSLCNEFQTMSTTALNIVDDEISTDGYRSIDFILPKRSEDNCGWAGMANLPGRFSWNMATEQWPPSPRTIVHEWGHQYSLAHLRAIRCTKDGLDVHFVDRLGRGAGQCAVSEYGGAFSVMGGGGQFGAQQILTNGERAQLGWLRPDEQQVAYDGTFTLGLDGPLSLLWLQNVEGDLFQVEYVPKYFGSSSGHFWDPFTWKWYPISSAMNYSQSGVMVKYLSTYSSYPFAPNGYLLSGLVIDATPQTIFSTDAAFGVGTSFVDPTGSLVIEVLTVDETSAQVRVRGIPFKPSQVQGVTASVTDVRGVFDLTFTPVVSDPPVMHYEVQTADNFAMKNSITVTVPGPGRVKIPNFNNTFMVYRIAAVNTAGRGEFNSGLAKLQWASNAKTQAAAGVKRSNEAPQTLKCRKGNRSRAFIADFCPVGWTKD